MSNETKSSNLLKYWLAKRTFLGQQKMLLPRLDQQQAIVRLLEETEEKLNKIVKDQPQATPPAGFHQLKPLFPQAVFQVATRLMQSHGRTTTLECKNELRRQGFHALQADISRIMSALAKEHAWPRVLAGNHYTYFPSRNPSLNPTPPAVDTSRIPKMVLLTVNDNETDAVLGAFCPTAPPSLCTSLGGTTYNDLGIHGGMRVVHTICEMGSSGLGASQLRVTDAIIHWTPSAVIAIGVAFGMRPDEQSIGDVLVSKQLQDYELAKLSKSGIVSRADRTTASTALLSRLKMTDAAKRRTDKTWPKVRFGLLLCGQKLVDNKPFLRKLWKLYPEAIGGEMEGTGVYAAAAEHVHWIVVKGICDWGYNKGRGKDAKQKLAANNAARVLKAAIDQGNMFQSSSQREP